MRAFLALTILLLGIGSAAPEPEYPSLFGNYLRPTGFDTSSLVEIESSTHRSDRLAVAGLQASEPSQAAPDGNAAVPPVVVAPVSADSPTRTEASLDDLCNALMASAEDNNLPVPFFANLIWQESKLRDDAVSPVGALGIAQFMPKTAVESGLANPFNPLQAIPASARLLHELRDQFGNLGFVAAAYNAGAHRVSEWLEHGRSLPRETLNYIVQVTGRSADEWRKTPPDDDALHFVPRLPCRAMPAYANLEQVQKQEEQAQQDAARQAEAEQQTAKAEQQAAKAQEPAEPHVADRGHSRLRGGRNALRVAARDYHDGKHGIAQRERGPHERYKSASWHRGGVHRA
jgi:hypothetical protein